MHCWDFDIFKARDTVGTILDPSTAFSLTGLPIGTLETYTAVCMSTFIRLACMVPIGVEVKVRVHPLQTPPFRAVVVTLTYVCVGDTGASQLCHRHRTAVQRCSIS